MKKQLLRLLLPLFLLHGTCAWAKPSDSLFKVGLIMPFKSNGIRNGLSEASLDYYEGVKLALQDLESNGMKMRLYVFDSQKDSFAMAEILEHPDLPGMNLIIGPAAPAELDEVAPFCRKYKIPLVSPLKYYTAPEESRSLVFNPFSNDSIRIKATIEKTVWVFRTAKIYILNDNSPECIRNIGYIKGVSGAFSKRSLSVIPYNNGNFSQLIPKNDSVVIIMPTARTGMLSAVVKFLEEQPKAVAVGHHQWYESLEATMASGKMNKVYLPEVNFVDQSDTLVQQFRLRYRDQFRSEPTRFVYVGYDQMLFFGQALMAFGRGFPERIVNGAFPMLQNELYFKKRNGSYDNYGINLITMGEFRPYKVHP